MFKICFSWTFPSPNIFRWCGPKK